MQNEAPVLITKYAPKSFAISHWHKQPLLVQTKIYICEAADAADPN